MFIDTKPRKNDITGKDVPSDKIYYEYLRSKSNSDKPTLILLPGGPGGDHSIYKQQAEKYLEFMDVVLFDPRGCGKSSIANFDCYHMAVYIDDIEDIRQHLNLTNVAILGTSYGSMVAQGYVIKYQKDVDICSLILVAGAPSHMFIDEAKAVLDKIGTPEQIETFHMLITGKITTDDELREYFRIMGPLYSVKAQKGGAFHAAKKDIRYNADAAIAGFGPKGFLRTFDWVPHLNSIKVPTNIIVGDKDWINPPSQATKIHDTILNSTLTVIENSGHFVWVDQTDQYISKVCSVIDSDCGQVRQVTPRARL